MLEDAMRFEFAIYGLFIYMVYWTEVYPESCETSKMQLFAKRVKVVNYFREKLYIRRLIGFWMRLCWMYSKLLGQVLLYIAVNFIFKIACIFCHFSTIRFETLNTSYISSNRSLRPWIYVLKKNFENFGWELYNS